MSDHVGTPKDLFSHIAVQKIGFIPGKSRSRKKQKDGPPTYGKTIGNFVFFYGSSDIFSQFHPAKFEVDGQEYNCMEQYMHHQKAGQFSIKFIFISSFHCYCYGGQKAQQTNNTCFIKMLQYVAYFSSLPRKRGLVKQSIYIYKPYWFAWVVILMKHILSVMTS